MSSLGCFAAHYHQRLQGYRVQRVDSQPPGFVGISFASQSGRWPQAVGS